MSQQTSRGNNGRKVTDDPDITGSEEGLYPSNIGEKQKQLERFPNS